jgi:HKD family nuclease
MNLKNGRKSKNQRELLKMTSTIRSMQIIENRPSFIEQSIENINNAHHCICTNGSETILIKTINCSAIQSSAKFNIAVALNVECLNYF